MPRQAPPLAALASDDARIDEINRMRLQAIAEKSQGKVIRTSYR
jgi:hypothetical protein